MTIQDVEQITALDSSVVYVSEATEDFSASRLLELADSSAEKNRAIRVTGYLYFAKGRFIQYLEGERSAVEKLLKRIQQDARHELISVAWEDRLEARRFPSWSMRWLRDFEVSQIGLEAVLTDYLVFYGKANQRSEAVDGTIQRILAGIAKLYARNS